MDMDKNNRNCYVCRGFGHIAKYCRNQGVGNNQRMEYRENRQDNLNKGRDLIGSN